MATTKIKLDKDLVEKASRFAETAGYGSVEEFISHMLEKELAKMDDAEDEEEIKEKLKGLGYIS